MVFDIPPRRLQVPSSEIQKEQAKRPRLSNDTPFEQITARLTAALLDQGIGVLDPEDDEDQRLDGQVPSSERPTMRH